MPRSRFCNDSDTWTGFRPRDGRGVRILKPNDTALQGINFDELEARRQFEYKKLGVMLNYASRFRKHCYRSFILSYFGEWNREP